MSDPIQSLTEIAERCRATAKAANPSRIPLLASDMADLCEIVAEAIKDCQNRQAEFLK